jgi:hypothetical protein
MDTNKIINDLTTKFKFVDVEHKTSFKAFRKIKNGTLQECIIEIFDAGTNVDSELRYACEIRRIENGEVVAEATGNPGKSIRHLQDLKACPSRLFVLH